MDVRRMRPKPKTSLLDKKIVKNPRYKNVENVVDTGNNLRKELEKLEEVHQYYKFRNDEVFRRVNINNLVRLLIEQTKLEYQVNPPERTNNLEQELELMSENRSEFNDSVADELEFDMNDLNVDNDGGDEDDIRSIIHSHYEPGTGRGDSRARTQSKAGVRRSVSSVANGIGEMDQDNLTHTQPQEKDRRPFLILDVRESEEYSRSHLAYSQSYHHTRLNRAFDYETREMLRVKNKPGHILVVCDTDESQASKFATTLTQRGYDNVFMLSGGLRVAQLKYPDGLMVSTDDDVGDRLEEGDVLLLEQALEDNILEGEAATGRRTLRSSSLSSNRRFGVSGFRTSTALGAK